MARILESLFAHADRHDFEREIAPGVRVHIRRPPRSLSLTQMQPLAALTDRVHDAWDVLWGKAHASAAPTLEQRLRRAA